MKLARIGALLLSLALFCGMLTACGDGAGDNGENNGGNGTPPPTGSVLPAGFEGIDFSNENIDFLMNHYKPFDSSPDTKVELGEFKGAKAAKITPAGDAVPYIAIDASSLLGDRITDVAAIEVVMGVDTDNFRAVSGEILAYSGADRTESTTSWSVFIETRNPNLLKMELKNDNQRMVSGAHNMFIISRRVDTAVETAKLAERTPVPAALYITHIGFLDSSGKYLPVNADAKFNAPDGFNESSTRYVELGVELEGDLPPYDEDDPMSEEELNALPRFMNNRNSDTQWGWRTNGTDNFSSPYLGADVSKAQQLVLEFATPPPGRVQLIWMSDVNGWNWTEEEIIRAGSTESEFTIDLVSLFSNYDDWKLSDQFKIYLGYFGYPCDNADCEDASCDECNRQGMKPGGVPDLGLTKAYFVINE